MDSKTQTESTREFALRRLRNFCTSYSLSKSDELLSHVQGTVIEGNYGSLSELSKGHLLDYMEALEEVLPALYELQEHLKMSDPERSEGT